ncbi:putative phosphohydrolases, Icc family [hydrothermal vent metagenome]|uniref:Putative phosphohydrolases, Icc family n=1 Tax=hydrothermal vent metagenome TaxID=652676 RepID=A0A3B0TBY1_9ZZZZ
MAFKLAHISDLHLEPPGAPSFGQLMSKRLIGYGNWRHLRRAHHRQSTLEKLVRDLKGQSPDHTALTGDLINFALPGEYDNAARWLRQFGRPGDVSVVPGNHDAYVRLPYEHALGKWAPYMTGDKMTRDWFGGADGTFPYVRIRGEIAIVGISSAIPSPWFMAYGHLGRSQLERLAVVLRRLGKEGLFRVVLIHHPPISASAARWKHLLDEKKLRAALERNGAELVLHGHLHRRSIRYLHGPQGYTPIVGVPSASLAPSHHRPSAAYNICHIDRVNGEWTLEIATRTIKPSGKGFADVAFNESSAPVELRRKPARPPKARVKKPPPAPAQQDPQLR